MARGVRGLLAPVLLTAACIGASGDPPAEPSWGIHAKADEGGCLRSAPLCWPADDAAAYRHYLAAIDAATLGDARAAVDAIHALEQIGHKLDDAELHALDRLRDAPPDDPALLAADIHARVAERISTGFLAAHAVPLGARATSPLGASDDGASSADAPTMPSGTAESLALLRESGVFGYAYALMLEVTGVLDREYPVWDERTDVPREVAAQEIIDEYTSGSTRAAVLVNAEGLIPYAGIVISVAHGSYMQFRLRARMVFEIAAVYGVNIHEGHNLLLATGVMMGAFGLEELRLLWGGTLAIPFIVRGVVRAGRLVDPRALLRGLAERAVRAILEAIGRASARATGRVGAQAVARGAARQVLGYATLGLAILGDIWLTRSATRALGEHVLTTLRPWVTGMLADGAEVLDDDETADCVASALGATITADGVTHDDELHLLAAHLARRRWSDGRWKTDGAIHIDHRALVAARSTPSDVTRCLRRTLRGRDADQRLEVLGWMRAAAAVDGDLGPAEDALWRAATDVLRGDGWFGDGAELEAEHLTLLGERARVVADPTHLVDEEASDIVELLGGVPTRDLYEGMDAAPTWAHEAVGRAFVATRGGSY